MSHNPGHVQPVPDSAAQPLEKSLETLIDQSTANEAGADAKTGDATHADAIHTTGHSKSRSWISRFWPSQEQVEKLFAYEHMGNYVIDRTTGQKLFESMPLYVRVGMHLLFCNGKSFSSYKSVEDLLTNQSIKQGKIYDEEGEEVLPHIKSFVDTYSLPLDELLESDLSKYKTFNDFFARKLRPDARPVDGQDDARVVTSPADCRMTVFEDVGRAREFWIKGKQFSIPELLGNDERFETLQKDEAAMLVVARLAPQDYHRFHAPCAGKIVAVKDIAGQLYTVNPQAVNEDLNVFTMNKRSVMLLDANLGPGREHVPVAFVAIGAMLVGSIGWSKKPGDTVNKGEELGWFAYGGSTCIVVLPGKAASGISLDDDLRKNSEGSVETVVRVGMRVGGAA